MIIFKLISVGFKQNLGLGVQIFILRAQFFFIIKNHIYIIGQVRGFIEPPGLKVTPRPCLGEPQI